jgi:hypothetical protein
MMKHFTFHCLSTLGQLLVAKWLYNLGDAIIHANGEEASIEACRNGHLSVAIIWLHNLGGVNTHFEMHECLVV